MIYKFFCFDTNRYSLLEKGKILHLKVQCLQSFSVSKYLDLQRCHLTYSVVLAVPVSGRCNRTCRAYCHQCHRVTVSKCLANASPNIWPESWLTCLAIDAISFGDKNVTKQFQCNAMLKALLKSL